MFGLSKLLRAGEGRTVKRLSKIADDVVALEDEYAALSDDELKAKTDEFKRRVADGESLDDIFLEAFATAREASWRVLGQKPTTSRSWAARPCTSATSPRWPPVRARP